MARWRSSADLAFNTREVMIKHYEDRIRTHPASVLADRLYGEQLRRLRGGEPLVLPGWALAGHVQDGVIRIEVGHWYRIEFDGRVVEVQRRNDPLDAHSVIAWDEVV